MTFLPLMYKLAKILDLAQTKGKIFLRRTLFFAEFAERPKEVPANTCKKSVVTKKFGMMAGLALRKKII